MRVLYFLHSYNKIALATHSHSSHYCRVESPRLVDGLSRSHCPHPSPTQLHTHARALVPARASPHTHPCPHRSPSTHPFRTYHRGTPRPHGSTHRFTASHSHNTLLAKTHPPKTLSHKHIKTQQAHARTHGKGITTCRGVSAALIRHVLSSHHACNASAGAVAGLSATAERPQPEPGQEPSPGRSQPAPSPGRSQPARSQPVPSPVPSPGRPSSAAPRPAPSEARRRRLWWLRRWRRRRRRRRGCHHLLQQVERDGRRCRRRIIVDRLNMLVTHVEHLPRRKDLPARADNTKARA